ncbi:unnamed protein product [Parajaminaea phylloscopi]
MASPSDVSSPPLLSSLPIPTIAPCHAEPPAPVLRSGGAAGAGRARWPSMAPPHPSDKALRASRPGPSSRNIQQSQ